MIGTLVLREGIARLRAAGVPDAPRDARVLLAHVWGVAPGRLTLALSDAVPETVCTQYWDAIARRATVEPVSHIVGKRAFYGRDFVVSGDVLDPRPETEALIHIALQEPWENVLDLGTGSGCILLTLLAENPSARGVGADISPAAITVAQGNASALGLDDRSRLIPSDWCANVDGRFDLIVSNPPYIAADEMAGLSPDVRNFEPHLALTDGADGLLAYRAICEQTPRHLAPGGRLIVEIGPTQADAVCAMMRAAGLETPQVHPDLDGRDRVVSARFPR